MPQTVIYIRGIGVYLSLCLLPSDSGPDLLPFGYRCVKLSLGVGQVAASVRSPV